MVAGRIGRGLHDEQVVALTAGEREYGVLLGQHLAGVDEQGVGGRDIIAHKAELAVLGRLRREYHLIAAAVEKGALSRLARRLAEPGLGATLVACGGHDDVAGPHEAVEHLVVELVVAPEVLSAAFAERDDTGFAHAVGIVEDVLEAKGIGDKGVFVDVGRVDVDEIFAHGIGHDADVALGGNALIGRVVAAACGGA